MRYSFALAATLLAAAPLALAVVELTPDNQLRVNPAQTQEISEPANNSSGKLTSLINGNISGINPSDPLQGSTVLSWDQEWVNGTWSFNTRPIGNFAGGWRTNGKVYEQAGGVVLNDGKVTLDTESSVSTSGNIVITLNTAVPLECTTAPANPNSAGANVKSTTVCRASVANAEITHRADVLMPRATAVPIA